MWLVKTIASINNLIFDLFLVWQETPTVRERHEVQQVFDLLTNLNLHTSFYFFFPIMVSKFINVIK